MTLLPAQLPLFSRRFKRAFHVGYGGHAAIPADGDGLCEVVKSGHRRRFSLSEYPTYGIVFQGELQ